MARHEMQLNAAAFQKIQSGRKKVELRLYDEKRQRVQIGDDILFTHRDNGDALLCQVVGLCRFADFADLIETLGAGKCGWDEAGDPAMHCKGMDAYYSRENMEKYGVLGIVIRPL